MKEIVLLTGKSGSGKSYISEKICNDFNKKEVISRTTRKPRFKGENTHLFVTNEQADKEFDKALAKTIFDGNRYYILEKDLSYKDLYIIDPYGVKSFEKNNIYFKTVYLDVPLWTRIKQMHHRGDTIKMIIRRVINDHKMFKNFKADYTAKTTDDVYYYFMNGIL